MAQEKKPLDSINDPEIQNPTPAEIDTTEEIAQIAENTVSEENIESDTEGSTVLTRENGMERKRDKSVLSLKKRRLRIVISLLVVIALLVGGIVGVGYIPEDADEGVSNSPSISMKKTDTSKIEKIIVNGDYGKLVFVSTTEKNTASESDTSSADYSSTYSWELEGYDNSLISSSAINAAADNLASIYASRIMEENQENKSAYGLDNPKIYADVILNEGENYTLYIGDKSPDGSGYYAAVTNDPKIYLVSAGVVNNFNVSPESLANTVILNAPTVDDVSKKTDKKYYNEEGTLSTFDTITLWGPKYGQKATISPIANNDFVQYSIDLGSYSRYADPDVVEDMFGLMTNGLVAIDTYALEPTDAEIKKYGLDNPELFINIKCGSFSVNLKAVMYDEENKYYAVMVDGLNAIYAVTADALDMLDYSLEDYFYQFVFQEYIYEFKNMTVDTGKKTYSFDIKHNTSDDSFTAKSNGKKIDDSLLSAYYQYFLVLSPEIKDSYNQNGEVALKATFTYKSSSKGQRVIELVKQTARRYLVKIDGNSLGVVNSADLDHLIVYAEYVMNNKGIPDPS